MTKGSVGLSNGTDSIERSKSGAYVFEEIIPGLSTINTRRSKKAQKISTPPPALSPPTPPEVDYSAYKSVNSITQYLYTRYRNAKKRLTRIEAREKAKAESSDCNIVECEPQLLSKKAEDTATVNEICKVLPQIAELSQAAIARAEEDKASVEVAHKQELENAIFQEREHGKKILLKAIDLFSSILLVSQDSTHKIEPEAKIALDSLAKSFTALPLNDSKKSALFECVNLFSSASETSIVPGNRLTYNNLNTIITSILTHEPVSIPFRQLAETTMVSNGSETAISGHKQEENSLASADSNEDFISEDDFDSPKITVVPYTIVPPGGISFLNPSEIFPGEPRGLFKFPIEGSRDNL